MDLILHIGCEKTGSTSVQEFLSLNRDKLKERGVIVPKSLGVGNHIKLPVAAMHGDNWGQLLRVYHGITSEKVLDIFRGQVRNDLTEELAGSSRAIISSEHLSSTLRTEEEIEWLREFLFSIFSNVHVIVYLRRQDQFHTSLYSTEVRFGRVGTLDYPTKEQIARLYDYQALLRRWSKAFPQVTIRRFGRSFLENGDVKADFVSQVGLGRMEDFKPGGNENTSLGIGQLDFVRSVNRFLPLMKGGKLNPDRFQLDKCLEILPRAGEPLALKVADARRLMAEVRENNLWVAEQFFSSAFAEGDPLFGPLDFNAGATQGTIATKVVLETALALARSKTKAESASDADLICEMFASWWAEKNRAKP